MPDKGPRGRPAIDITVHVSAPAWLRAEPDLEPLAHRALEGVLRDAGHAVAVVFADDDFVRGLNARYRGKDKPTNVLSFPNGGGDPGSLGDLILAFETVSAEARSEGKPLGEHVAHLLIHGALHLLGHDHHTDEDHAHMVDAEIAALAQLGIPDPYLPRAAPDAEDAA